MRMNTLEQEDIIKGLPDDALVKYMQSPSGELAQYLVASELQHRTDMRNRFAAKEEQPEQTVAEQIVAAASPEQGIGSLQPQMPPQGLGGAMPPSGPMGPPQMPPEMMAAQGNPMASQMPMMAGGGMIPPNSLAEDASKYNPEMLYDLDPSQIGMISPTDMGIPSVLPMARGGVVRMDNGGVAEDGGYPQWARDWVVDPSNPLEVAMMGGTALGGIGGLALGANVARKVGMRGFQKLFKHIGKKARQKGKTERGDKGRILSDEASGKQIFGRGSGTVKEHLSPFKKDFWFKTLPAASGAGLVGTKAYQQLIEDQESGSLGSGGMRPWSEEEINDQLGLKGGGIIKMNEGGMTWGGVTDALIAKGVASPPWLVDKPANEFLNADDIAQMKAYVEARKSVDPRGETQPPVNLTSGKQGLAKSLYTPESGLSQDLSDEPPITAAPPSIDLETAMGQGQAEGGLGLTKYDLSAQIKELDTTTQKDKIQSQINALEKFKGQTPDTFDITESVLRSGERADERAISQALINLGAGIASGDIAEGFRTAGTAVSGIREKQEQFQQLAEIRKAEAQAKASSDKMTRDISITASQITAYGDLQDQKNAASELLMDREKMLIDATASGNANLIAQATNNRDVASMAIQISQFNETLGASIKESISKTERAKIRREQAAITALGPDALRKGYGMDSATKAAWVPDNLPDKTPGWSPSRALRDLLAGLGYLSSLGVPLSDDGVLDFGFSENEQATGFRLIGSGS